MNAMYLPSRSRIQRKAVTLVMLAGGCAVALMTGCESAAVDRAGHESNHHDVHAEHDDPNRLELSPQAQRNIHLEVGLVKLSEFQRAITIPAMVVERPGRTSVAVPAPLSGVVDQIYAVEGESVAPGQRLFEVRLTHEEIVQAQAEFLKTAAELDVIAREVARLDDVVAQGAIAGKTLLERKYEQERQEAVLNAQREALLLHGLSEEQVAAILRDRKLLHGLTVYAPKGERESTGGAAPMTWQIQQLRVQLGQHVTAGDTMAVLADYRTLFIEGKAFEQDASEIDGAAEHDWPITAVIESAGSKTVLIEELAIAFTAGRVDPESRTLQFYVKLPNRVLRNRSNSDGHRFVDWQFKPGQRVELRVPVERWAERIVLPVGAVAREGPESYVFQASGNSFIRRPVHEEYRDQISVVIANDGSVFPGEHVALSGAQQMQLAIKNKAGGTVDPHAGHSH